MIFSPKTLKFIFTEINEMLQVGKHMKQKKDTAQKNEVFH